MSDALGILRHYGSDLWLLCQCLTQFQDTCELLVWDIIEDFVGRSRVVLPVPVAVIGSFVRTIGPETWASTRIS